jgi:hypothetical protein
LKTSENQKEVSAKTNQNQKLKAISWSLPNPRRLRLRARKRPRKCACGHVGGASAIGAASQKLSSRHPVLTLESENTNVNVLCQNVVREKKQQANDHAARECESEHAPVSAGGNEPVNATADGRDVARHLGEKREEVNMSAPDAVRKKKSLANSSLFVAAPACVREK